ncbi:MAG TPA: YidC/Oxa1 family membrane protein insertase [Acidimicrobiales bacterium]|nr:YidC/Oxa1 family membrane protein insertase [Acidimicrobiales bacterium]
MFQFLAGVLAFFYSIIPNYVVAIALLTIMVMLVLSPLTLKGTRGMLAMQKMQPEMKRLQQQHKGDRQKLGEEMTNLYKEHKINPAAGCLPMLLQLPVFFVMYHVISGLTKTTKGIPDPKYLDKGTDLYQALRESGGKMMSFGVDLAKSASEGHGSFLAAIPFFVVVALVVLTQYYQTRQTMARNTQTSNPQQQILLKVMPGFFGLISLSIPAGVNIYFLVSALFRICQTGAMYRFDPTLKAHAERHVKDIEAKATEVKRAKQKGAKAPEAKPKEISPKAKPGQANGRATNPKGSATPARNANRNKQRSKRRAKKGR